MKWVLNCVFLCVWLQYGMTPLILATQKNSEQLINVLIHAGADVDAIAKNVITITITPIIDLDSIDFFPAEPCTLCSLT